MSGFVLLWQKTLYSSIWVKGTKDERLLWMTILMMKGKDGIIQSSLPGLADAAKISPDECRAALATFLAPDPDDSSLVDEGRKLRVIPGGWQVVNHDLYRFSTPEKRAFWAAQKAEQRAKLAKAADKPKRKTKAQRDDEKRRATEEDKAARLQAEINELRHKESQKVPY